MAIFKKQGVWWIDFYVCGKRKRERVGHSHKLAEEVLHKRKLEVAEGRFFPDRQKKSTSFREISEQYWKLHGQHLRSATTWQYMLKKITDRFGNKSTGDISVAEIQAFYNEIRARASVSTANRYLTLFKSVFNRAIAWELFNGVNPAAKIAKLKEPANRLRYLSQTEIRSILGACDARIRPLLAAALLTGMRRGELLALTWANIDLAQGIIYITKSKSGKPREIPIAQSLRDILEGMGHQEPAAKVFDLPIITLRRYFDKALSAAGISGFHFHDLRHTFASHFIMKTGNLPALQKLLGHASPMMTQRYAHLSDGYLQAEMRSFNTCMPITPESTPKAIPMDTYMDTKHSDGATKNPIIPHSAQ